MAVEFTEQEGVASSTPSAFQRWIGSKVSSRLFSLKRRDKNRRKVEAARKKAEDSASTSGTAGIRDGSPPASTPPTLAH